MKAREKIKNIIADSLHIFKKYKKVSKNYNTATGDYNQLISGRGNSIYEIEGDHNIQIAYNQNFYFNSFKQSIDIEAMLEKMFKEQVIENKIIELIDKRIEVLEQAETRHRLTTYKTEKNYVQHVLR